MRLIHTRTLKLKSFRDSNAPPYAILSHRWGKEEVGFEQIGTPEAATCRGYAKLANFCDIAASDGYDYAWMDTCCIDKRSSSEESESINSMYRWYSQAGCCYVYLCDVSDRGVRFEYSIWFSRGWTLQELIAPQRVQFYGADWQYLGNKISLIGPLVETTGIDGRVLQGAPPGICSIAQRLSWAADRTTERIEDRAYSLIGLFNISLSANYGEREESFVRLQKEIIKEDDDQSIFCWEHNYVPDDRPDELNGLLARSPSAFRGCHKVVRSVSSGLNLDGYALGQLGLTLTLWTKPWAMYQYLAVLDCQDQDDPYSRYSIIVERLSVLQQFARVYHQDCGRYIIKNFSRKVEENEFVARRMSIKQRIIDLRIPPQLYGFKFGTLVLPGYTSGQIQQLRICSRGPKPSSADYGLVLLPVGSSGTAGVLYSTNEYHKWYSIRHIRLGFDTDFNPVILLGFDGPTRKPQPQLSDEADPNIHSLITSGSYPGLDNKPAFSSTWLNVRADELESKHTSLLDWRGLHILKGDSTGIDVVIPALNIRVLLRKEHYPWPEYLSNSQQQTPVIWTLSILRTWNHDRPDTFLNKAMSSKRNDQLAGRIMKGLGLVTGLAMGME